ncbi:MAG: 16S rRNA (cytosine(1402)-N(4))-methyltransferase RsmH [Clostridia bacterium]|nr:16S rRNA (cytosine(1402)-N(4))-methyltransferase RsmH [Clostridia bacterium]
METPAYHRPVLLQQTLDALDIQPEGVYLDGTAGGGGHSFAIASRLTTGRLISLDQDPDAIKEAGRRLEGLPVTLVRSNFRRMREVLAELEISGVDGILLDIGVSSHQLDTPERGFSYHYDAPLDMRMSQEGPTAADLVNTLEEVELARIFYNYGEEKFSRPIARAICRRRETTPITTTLELAELIAGAMPAAARRDGHPARRVFQALRIAVNGELDALDEALDAAFDSLRVGGRLAIITFHSLEDRLVKLRFNEWKQGCVCPPDFPVCVCGRTPAGRLVLRHPAEATPEELTQNPRSRSARLRCIEKRHDRY